MNILLAKAEAAVVIAALRDQVQRIEFDLGNSNNPELSEKLRVEREVLVRAVGELTLGALE